MSKTKGFVLSLHREETSNVYQEPCLTANFVDRAPRYNYSLMTNLTLFFIHLFITTLYMFRAS